MDRHAKKGLIAHILHCARVCNAHFGNKGASCHLRACMLLSYATSSQIVSPVFTATWCYGEAWPLDAAARR